MALSVCMFHGVSEQALGWLLIPSLGLRGCGKILLIFYTLKFVEKFERIEFPKPQVAEIKQEIAPYNGFGSVEDSMASCLNLIPKAPRRYVHVCTLLTLHGNPRTFHFFYCGIGTLSSLCKRIVTA